MITDKQLLLNRENLNMFCDAVTNITFLKMLLMIILHDEIAIRRFKY